MRGLVVGLVLMAGSVAADQVYRCEIDGQLVFSQQPCADGAEKIQMNAPPPGAGVAVERPAHDSSYIDRVRIERRISRHQATIRSLQSARDRELAELRRKMSHANNNQAGATWIQGLSTEMTAVSSSYGTRIEVEQRAIDRLREDLAGL